MLLFSIFFTFVKLYQTHSNMENTLLIIKPGALQRELAGEINSRF
jgi:hypothetical protein